MELLYTRDGSVAPGPVSDAQLIELYRHPAPAAGTWVRTNFVTSLDGSIAGPDGRSGTINTPSDQHVFALHRAWADAVLVGAGTVRAEGYRAVDLAPWQRALRAAEGLAPYPTLVIISGSLELADDLVRPDGGPVLVLTGRAAPERGARLRAAGVEVVDLGGERVPAAAALDHLARAGLGRVVCEGGPQLHRDLLDAGEVDELSLTLAPVVVGGGGGRTTSGEALDRMPGFTVTHVLLGDDGALFTRYRRA